MTQIFGDKSYAQHNDDVFLVNVFDLIGIRKPSYLDLGAHHPTEISNTALLYARGSSGVNVEANPSLIPAFIKDRPRDVNLSVGVGPTRGRMPFYMFDNFSGLNSFSKEDTDKITHSNPTMRVKKTLDIDIITIEDIITQHCNGLFPDLLNTDVEGWDHAILEACDFSKSRPKVICAEIRPWAADATKEMLYMKGYFCLCRIQANLIFVHTDFRDKVY